MKILVNNNHNNINKVSISNQTKTRFVKENES